MEFTSGGGKLTVDKMHAGLKRHLETGAIVTPTYLATLLAEALAVIDSFDQATADLMDAEALLTVNKLRFAKAVQVS